MRSWQMITRDLAEIDGICFKIQFYSILINLYFSIPTMNRNRKRYSTDGGQPFLILKIQSMDRIGIMKMWFRQDGSMPSEGNQKIKLRGVPIQYYKIMISVFFNKNFTNLKLTYDKLKSQVNFAEPLPLFGLEQPSIK